MNTYTKVLEFFMENGVQLTPEQMSNLKVVCGEATLAQRNAVMNQFNKDPDIINKYNKDLARQIYKAEELNDKSDIYKAYSKDDYDKAPAKEKAKINKAIWKNDKKAIKADNKAQDMIKNMIDRDEAAAYKENEKRNKNQ